VSYFYSGRHYFTSNFSKKQWFVMFKANSIWKYYAVGVKNKMTYSTLNRKRAAMMTYTEAKKIASMFERARLPVRIKYRSLPMFN